MSEEITSKERQQRQANEDSSFKYARRSGSLDVNEEERLSRVVAIKEQIQSGTYKVSCFDLIKAMFC